MELCMMLRHVHVMLAFVAGFAVTARLGRSLAAWPAERPDFNRLS